MMLLIRSGSGARVQLPRPGRALLRAARGLDAVLLRALAGFAALLVLVLIGVPAQADEIEPEPDPAPRVEPKLKAEPDPEPAPVVKKMSAGDEFAEPSWIPSVEIGFETFDYDTDSTVQNFINPPAWAGAQAESERQLMFRIGGELMGPIFEDLPGRPRLFAQGGVQLRTFSSDQVFILGDPSVPLEPESSTGRYLNLGDLGQTLPGDFPGQGGEIFAQFQDPSWYAGLGVAFSVPIAKNLLLYLKPSVQYSMEKIDMSGSLTTVDEPIPRVDPVNCPQTPNNPQSVPCVREFFIHRSRAFGRSTDHSVGPGLELALVLFRSVRPIQVSLYANARFMWLVSGSTTEFADPNGVAAYSVSRDEFAVRGGGGLRFSWVGFD